MFTRRTWYVAVLLVVTACSDNSASDGSSGETGSEEEGGSDGGQNPGPDGPGCDELWEGFWDSEDEQGDARQLSVRPPESDPQSGQFQASGSFATQHPPVHTTDEEDTFRATYLGEDAVFTTGRQISLSWCLGAILPYPIGPGSYVDPEEDAGAIPSFSRTVGAGASDVGATQPDELHPPRVTGRSPTADRRNMRYHFGTRMVSSANRPLQCGYGPSGRYQRQRRKRI
jgi:hypothetical protein